MYTYNKKKKKITLFYFNFEYYIFVNPFFSVGIFLIKSRTLLHNKIYIWILVIYE